MGVWQPIETAPKDGTDVLLYYPECGNKIWLGRYVVHESYTHGKLDYRSEHWSIGALPIGQRPEPSHWMPLPIFMENNERVTAVDGEKSFVTTDDSGTMKFYEGVPPADWPCDLSHDVGLKNE